MTFLEKAMEIEKKKENGLPKESIVVRYCPSSYSLEGGRRCKNIDQERCFECWNREMPNTESKELKFPTEDWRIGYEKGLNDAWELAKKIYLLADRKPVFANHEFMEDIFDNFTPQEALAKLKAYEEAQIKVGDVVSYSKDNIKGLVLHIDEPDVFAFVENGGVEDWHIELCKKTGKHIDIQSILEQIGECAE